MTENQKITEMDENSGTGNTETKAEGSEILESIPSQDIPEEFTSLIKDGKNATSVVCQRCGSIVLRPGSAVFAKKEICLPSMRKKKTDQVTTDSGDADADTLSNQWLVSEMFTFENVGFSNTVGTAQYLICADCEIGPIGFHDISVKTEFYIALSRVEHKD